MRTGPSQFGAFFDQIVSNPSQYGFTSATNACVNGNQVCATPSTYFFYYGGHPSTAASQIVGNELYQEALVLPEPATLTLFGAALGPLLLGGRGRLAKPRKAQPGSERQGGRLTG